MNGTYQYCPDDNTDWHTIQRIISLIHNALGRPSGSCRWFDGQYFLWFNVTEMKANNVPGVLEAHGYDPDGLDIMFDDQFD